MKSNNQLKGPLVIQAVEEKCSVLETNNMEINITSLNCTELTTWEINLNDKTVSIVKNRISAQGRVKGCYRTKAISLP